jgi:Flp pilus assembly protein TadD
MPSREALQRTLEEALRCYSEGRLDAALAHFEAFIAVEPRFAPAHNNRGHILTRLGRPAEALGSLETAIRLDPSYASAFSNLGCALRDLGRSEEALDSLDAATTLEPDFAEAHSNRGNALLDLGRPDEALASYERALQLKPSFGDAHRNRGTALYKLNRPHEAAESYGEAARLDPGDVQARHHQALALLLAGDFERGWGLYETRKRIPGGDALRPDSGVAWLGDRDVSGATVLVYGEEGLGDTIQFCRFAPRLGAQRLILRVQRALTRLLAASFPDALVLGADEPLPPFDAHCALMSLPLALKLGPASFAPEKPYLHADPGLADAWRARLGPAPGPRIGVAWSGAAIHKDDRNRSIALPRLAPLLGQQAEWVCLQDRVRAEDAGALALLGQVRFVGEQLSDFAETAALVAQMDLVITVDTSIAHLAGAMGKPVWILLPFSPDWRWGLEGAATPWYPSARLFRQPKPGDWEAVVADVARELNAWRPASPT